MLTSDVKRRIDAARDVLVGVAPNPTTQIEQITFALIYKFMHDMDQSAVKAGGGASFFTGTLKKYSWDKVLDSRLGNHEKLALYAEALEKFTEAKQLPELFRSIFRSAYLPYKSPETLGLFLKEMNHFDYTHPEELGNAYEYLLSIMSSQGDAGQFRTPRHIIDFMVDVINPSKDDRILDPACGTGGFLISSYKHILEQHDRKNDPKKEEKPLTPDDRKKLMANLEGYDIDPTMVRIAQVNMYLHQFKNPQIFQYDTLTSEERWNDKYDVILANPPFMSPKGGIRPHNKFGVSSNRSEVLFVDYIINHLKPKGRAGIVVPEGIIFQSGSAYRELRRNLIENGLYAVVSLPGGVFQPYSGVKTSILFIDRETSNRNPEIAFVKISADGFDPGSTKRVISQNDLPEALKLLSNWIKGGIEESPILSLIQKSEIKENRDFNLLGDRYKVGIDTTNAKWPVTRLSEFCSVSAGNSAPQGDSHFKNGKYPFFRTSDVGAVHLSTNLQEVSDYLNDAGIRGLKLFTKGTILFPKSGASTFLNHRVIMGRDGYVASHLGTITVNPDLALEKYVYFMLTNVDAKTLTADQTYPSLKLEDIGGIEIPLPPLEVQQQIVNQLSSYDEVISGAKQIIENWKPRIDEERHWPRYSLSQFVKIDKQQGNHEGLPFVGLEDIESHTGRFIGAMEPRKVKSSTFKFDSRHTLYGQLRPYLNKFLVPDFEGHCSTEIQPLLPSKELHREFLGAWLATNCEAINATSFGARMPRAKMEQVLEMEIGLPTLIEQNRIVEEIRQESIAVGSARKLIATYEARTQSVISKIWDINEGVE
jgi:type I restriction enzyme M protein